MGYKHGAWHGACFCCTPGQHARLYNGHTSQALRQTLGRLLRGALALPQRVCRWPAANRHAALARHALQRRRHLRATRRFLRGIFWLNTWLLKLKVRRRDESPVPAMVKAPARSVAKLLCSTPVATAHYGGRRGQARRQRGSLPARAGRSPGVSFACT